MFPGRSPYEYCFSNPINLTDPTGMAPDGGEDPPHVYDLDEVVVSKNIEGRSKVVDVYHGPYNTTREKKIYRNGEGYLGEDDYYESWRSDIRAYGQGYGNSINGNDVLGKIIAIENDEVRSNLIAWALSCYDLYGGKVPKARGNIDFDHTSSAKCAAAPQSVPTLR
jgi:hypothetical protein